MGEKPKHSHLHPLGCKAYVLNHDLPKRERKNKLYPRAHIRYLVGYDSTHIWRIWIPSKSRVIRTRDVTFDDNSMYSLFELDIGAVIRESADRIIKTLDITDCTDDEQVDSDVESTLDFIEVEVPASPEASLEEERPDDSANQSPQKSADVEGPQMPQLAQMPQLLTLDATPTPEPKNTSDDTSELASVNQQTSELSGVIDDVTETQELQNALETATANTRLWSIGGLEPRNMITGRRRRGGLFTQIRNSSVLSAFYAAFNSTGPTIHHRPHRDTLPPPPRSYTAIQRHIQKNGFRAAADKEIRTLQEKNTFEYVDESEAKDTVPLPLMWVFTNKFDENGYLLKEKARIIVRGDLHITDDDTYAATLAAQTFRAVMALVAGFDLETRQYDVVKMPLRTLNYYRVYCECVEGYGQPGKIWKVEKALYGLWTSPLLWYKDCTDGLGELGLESVPDTNYLFVNSFMKLMFFVDDITVAYRQKDQYQVDDFERKL